MIKMGYKEGLENGLDGLESGRGSAEDEGMKHPHLSMTLDLSDLH